MRAEASRKKQCYEGSTVPRRWRQKSHPPGIKVTKVTAGVIVSLEETGRKSRRNKKLSGCIRDRNQESLERNWEFGDNQTPHHHDEWNEQAEDRYLRENLSSEARNSKP